MTFHIPHIPYYKYPHYPQKLYGAYWEKNPKKSFYNTPTLLEREQLILRREIFVVSSPSLSHCYTQLRGDLYSNTTHTHSKCWGCFWSLVSIGWCQGWWMQCGAYYGIQKARVIHQNALCCRKMTFHIPHVPYYKYPHYAQKWCGAYWEKNPKKIFYNTPTLLERELFILRREIFVVSSPFLPIVIPN